MSEERYYYVVRVNQCLSNLMHINKTMKLFKTPISTTATTSPVGLDKAWNLCKSLPGWFWRTQQPRGSRSCIQKPHNYMAFKTPYSVKILMKSFLIAWSSLIFAYQKHTSKIENIWKCMSLWPVFQFFLPNSCNQIIVYLKIQLLYKRTSLTWASYKEMIMLILQMFTEVYFMPINKNDTTQPQGNSQSNHQEILILHTITKEVKSAVGAHRRGVMGT